MHTPVWSLTCRYATGINEDVRLSKMSPSALLGEEAREAIDKANTANKGYDGGRWHHGEDTSGWNPFEGKNQVCPLQDMYRTFERLRAGVVAWLEKMPSSPGGAAAKDAVLDTVSRVILRSKDHRVHTTGAAGGGSHAPRALSGAAASLQSPTSSTMGDSTGGAGWKTLRTKRWMCSVLVTSRGFMPAERGSPVEIFRKVQFPGAAMLDVKVISKSTDDGDPNNQGFCTLYKVRDAPSPRASRP